MFITIQEDLGQLDSHTPLVHQVVDGVEPDYLLWRIVRLDVLNAKVRMEGRHIHAACVYALNVNKRRDGVVDAVIDFDFMR